MVLADLKIDQSYWQSLEITLDDIDFLYAYLLEKEAPLPSFKLAEALIKERFRLEKARLQKKQQENGEIYYPKNGYQIGEKIQFPALNWISGTVSSIRKGNNPEHAEFEVMSVSTEDGKTRFFAINHHEHILNESSAIGDVSLGDDEQATIDQYAQEITGKLEEKLDENKDLVRIGANWFAKSLLIEFNVGHLNLAEAVLDMHAGGPLAVSDLLEQLDVDSDDPVELVEFSLNYALQADPRFDEVGPSGVLQWFLNRLEPNYVREIPIELAFEPITYDRSLLTEDMLKSEQMVDDELVEPLSGEKKKTGQKEVSVVLNYPHWRTGSIPLTANTRPFFPTAIETPRVKFKLVDNKGQTVSAWVVRPYSYVFGLRDWYEELELMPGSIIKIKPGKELGEVIIEPEKKRSNREWIKTLLVGADGGIVIAMLKQTITADFNERMAIAIPSTDVLDELWQKRAKNPRPLKSDIVLIMRELGKLNPQGQVHSLELYASLNCIHRCPPGVLFSVLASNPEFDYVGDLYYRLNK